MRKLLIADDEEGIRTLVRMTLESDAYEILEAGDGEEALRAIREERPALVLLDVEMPHMSGLEVCRAVKDDEETADTRIVMLSARAQDSDREMGRLAGADDYFVKPFSPLALLAKIDEVFGETGA